MRLLTHYKVDCTGKRAVVVGRSAILGKPMAIMLLNANATVTICHSKSKNLAEEVGRAEILVGAVGRPEFIKSDWELGVVTKSPGRFHLYLTCQFQLVILQLWSIHLTLCA